MAGFLFPSNRIRLIARKFKLISFLTVFVVLSVSAENKRYSTRSHMFVAEDVTTHSFSEELATSPGMKGPSTVLGCAARCLGESLCHGFYFNNSNTVCRLMGGTFNNSTDSQFNKPGIAMYRDATKTATFTDSTTVVTTSAFVTDTSAVVTDTSAVIADTSVVVTTSDVVTTSASETTSAAITTSTKAPTIVMETTQEYQAPRTFAMATVPVTDSATCERGLRTVHLNGKNHCFLVINVEVDFLQARQICKEKGALLFHFDRDLDKFIGVKDAIQYINPEGVTKVWVGMHTLYGFSQWTWDHNNRTLTQEEVDDLPWQKSNPHIGNTCVQADLDIKKIDDLDCGKNTTMILCEDY